MSAFSPSTNSITSGRPQPRLPTLITAGLPRQPHGNVRRRGRERWQARIYVGGRAGGSVHLGMYESETAAEQVCRKVLRVLLGTSIAAAEREDAGGAKAARVIGPLDVWQAAQKLADGGWDVGGQLAGLLPRCVCPDGRGGYGIRVKGGNGCDRGGFADPLDAYKAAVRERRRLAQAAAEQKLAVA
jgi:hypothetical protein